MSQQISRRLIPLFDRILVRKFKPLEKTASGILLPEKAIHPTLLKGEVLAVGPGTEEHKMCLKVGDKVVLPQYGGQHVKFDGISGSQEESQLGITEGEELMLYKESEILAKVMS